MRKSLLVFLAAAMWVLSSTLVIAQCTPDAFEEDDACVSSKTVIYGGDTQSHNFCTDTEDWIKFNACAGRSYTIDAVPVGSLADVALELYSTDCASLLDSNYGGAPGTPASIVWVAPAEGTYHIKVLQFDGTFGDNREYDITLTGNTSSCSAWARTYGDTSWEDAHSVQQTSDGGYVVTGYTKSFGAGTYDFWVLKLFPDATIDWENTYGGASSDEANSIQQTADGGFVVAGETLSFGANPGVTKDFWVLKLDSFGTIDWERTYGGTSTEIAESIQQTSDGDFVVAGFTRSSGAGSDDFWVLKLDASTGNVVWENTYGGTELDQAYSIRQTADDGFIVAGRTSSFGAGGSDFWVLKLSPVGAVEWEETYGGIDWDNARSIQQTADDGFIVAGRTLSFGAGSDDFWVLKLSPLGAIEWENTYGGAFGDAAYSIQQTTDGGYVVGGETGSFGAGNTDFWVLKLDASGNVSWQKTYGGASADYLRSDRSIRQTSDGGFVVAGETQSFGADSYDVWVLKLRENGEIHFPACALVADTSATVTGSTAMMPGSTATVLSDGVIPDPALVSGLPSAAAVDVQCATACAFLSCSADVDAAAVCIDTQQNFTGSISDSGEGALSYAWDFDYDGVTFDVMATTTTASYTYPATGDFTAAFRVTDSCADPSPQECISTIAITIYTVAFDAAFDPVATLSQKCGDGDSIVEPGERWGVTVQLVNLAPTCTANNVKADLTINAGSAVAATVCLNPGLYGTMPGGATAQFTYQFEVDSAAVCVDDITFDVTSIVSDEAPYFDQIPAFNVQVGDLTPPVTFLSEDFEACVNPPVGWTVDNLPAPNIGWTNAGPLGSGCESLCEWEAFPTNYYVDDSWCSGFGNTQDDELISPVMNASAVSVVTLTFEHDFLGYWEGANDDFATVRAKSTDKTGGAWVTLIQWDETQSNAGTIVLDATAECAGAVDCQFEWHYQGYWDLYWAVDNVVVTGANILCDVSVCTCACVLPEIAYDAAFDPTTTLSQKCGDGDAIVEPGERWSVTVQLANNAATCTANNVKADLTVNAGSAVAATVCLNPGLYGTMPGSAAAQFTYEFEVDPAAVCVNDITFDVTNVVSDEAAYPDQIPAFNVTVGTDAASELGTQATDPLNTTGAPAASDFAPDFTLVPPAASASLDWASLTHDFVGTLNYTYSPVPATVARKTTTTFTLAVVEVQTVSAVTTTINLTPPVRDGGGDTLDVILQSPAPALTQQIVYSGDRALWASGTFGPYAAFNGEANSGDWQLIVTHTAGGGSGSDGTLDQWDLAIDYSDPGDVTANTKVELVGPPPANNAITLKDYTEAPSLLPYTTEVLTHYNNEGSGTYQIRLSENAGGTATLTGATMSVDVTAQCDAGACGCSAPPPLEPSPPGSLEPLIIPTTADQIIVEDVADETGYVVYEGAIGTWYGTPSQGCLWGAADVVDLGATVQLNYPIVTPGDRWVVVSAANASGESSCGTDSAGAERNAQPGWPAPGPCP